MPSVNKESLRQQFSEAKQSATELIAQGNVSPEIKAVITTLLTLMEIVIAVFLEKMTKKTKSNSGVPPSATSKVDDAEGNSGSKSKGSQTNKDDFSNARTQESVERLEVYACECCGADLSDHEPHTVLRRTKIDLYFEKVVEHQETEAKSCSQCDRSTHSQFSSEFQHVKQYGIGLQAFIVNLLCAQMVSLQRVQQLLKSILGEMLSEATLLKYVMKLSNALERWEASAIEQLLTAKAMHVDETSMRVDSKNHWVHVCSAGTITVKMLHVKRGKEAMDDHNIIPRYGGVIVHDCWSSYFKFESCEHGLCGAHLIRELAFIVESNDYVWARRMKKLLLMVCKSVSRREQKKVSVSQYARIQALYQKILIEGQQEMPKQPTPEKKKRGRVAKTDAENLCERLQKHEASVLLFARNSAVPFTNNQAERALRMGKVKQKVSGCFRTLHFAKAYVRISSYLQTMTAQGYNPLKAIQMALSGELYAHEV